MRSGWRRTARDRKPREKMHSGKARMSGRHRAIVGRVQCAEFMDTNEILYALKEERERLSRAIGVLEGGSRGAVGRPAAVSGARQGRRRMSPEARARIAAAQRKRWAKVKAKKK